MFGKHGKYGSLASAVALLTPLAYHPFSAPGPAGSNDDKMSSNTSNVLFDDIFTINDIDKEGKKFDRGARSVHMCPVI